MELYVTIESGQVKNKTTLRDALKSLRDGRYSLKIEPKNKRTLPQNAFYWAVVCQIVLDCLRDVGYNEIRTVSDVHEILKYKFLKKQVVSEHGEVIEVLKSTAELSKQEFNTYLEEIAQWVAESFGVTLPAPGTQSKIVYE